jgi:hypothetical protein
MAVSLTVETGAGITGANTYISLANADTYADARVAVSAWGSATDDEKNRALVQAARVLDRYVNWIGWKTDDDNVMQWPRAGIYYDGYGNYYASWDIDLADSVYSIDDDEIPQELKDAQCELALVLISKDTQALPSTAGFKSISVAGAVDLDIDKHDRVKELPVHVWKMISHLGARKGGATVQLMRG